MKTARVTGPFCHELAIMVVLARWPALVHGRDFFIGQAVDESRDPIGEPMFISWNVQDIPRPEMAELASEFAADESRYRAALARRVRNSMLAWSDAKAIRPGDAPDTFLHDGNPWIAWRQALRDIPQQPGFPFDIDWPGRPDGGPF